MIEQYFSEFKNKELLREALTHPGTDGDFNYVRLAYLGNTVLSLVLAEWLFKKHPEEEEGQLSERRAALENMTKLSDIAKAIGLGEHLIASKGIANQPTAKGKIYGRTLQAFVGAIYQDRGLEAAESFVRLHWKKAVEEEVKEIESPKNVIEEWAGTRRISINYEHSTRGPDHMLVHISELTLSNGKSKIGEGSSKVKADQDAASKMIKELGLDKKTRGR